MSALSAAPKKRLLVTGWSGFVAGSVIVQAQRDWEVHGVGRTDPPADTQGIHYHRLDLLEKKNVQELFAEIRPDAVVHAAAIADIDFCQQNQDIAFKINVESTNILSNLCGDIGSKFVFCSTDNVFDGRTGFYSETDDLNPVNFYGETKVLSEQIVNGFNARGVVARLALVIGLPVMGRGNSFLSGAIEKWKDGRTGEYPENEIRTPIDVVTLGKALVELAGNDIFGTIHLAGNTRLNRCQMAQDIAGELGYSTELIQSVNSNAIDGRAARPDDASLKNLKARRLLETPMLSLSEGLDLTMNYRAP